MRTSLSLVSVSSVIVASVFVAAAVSVACSSSSSDDVADASTGQDAASDAPPGQDATSDAGVDPSYEFCAASEARAAKCKEEAPAECTKDKACYESTLRAGVAAGIEHCISDRPCNKGDDSCFSEAAAPFANEPDVMSFVAACNQKRAACDAADGGSFVDDFCGATIGLFPATMIAAQQACFDGACTDVAACLKDTLEGTSCGE